VIDLLEQIHDLLGDEVISNKDYLELLEAGFEEIRLGTLPQETDRLLVGDIERTRVSQCRILFFTGVNDGNIPRGTSRGGLLSDLDREFLRSFGAELSPTPRQQMYMQRLYLYMNMTKPTDALYLSFARTTPEGGSLHPSYLIPMIRKLFPEAVVEHPQLRPAAEQLTGKTDSTVWLSGSLRDYAQGRIPEKSKDADAVKTTYGLLMRTGGAEDKRTLDNLKEAAFKKYDPVMISPETAKALYGNSIMGGITRMETAAKCSLRHFLQYGLGLKERKEFAVESLDTGSILT
jgi:ATP-dependent helicase/nuclease subunit B